MKMFNKYPNVFRFALAIVLFAVALFISGLIDSPLLKKYFPFSSAILLGLATWVLYKAEGKSLQSIGLTTNRRKLSFLPLGIVIGAVTLLAAKAVKAIYAGESIAISGDIDYTAILYGMYILLPTVAVEEFLFRGYLFKKTIEVSNVVTANIIFSILFMSIHVIDESVINNIGMLLILLMSIPVGHLFFATGLLRSRTIFFPIGLHLGNNWATQHLITSNDTGNSIFYTYNNATFDTWPFFIGFLLLFNVVFLLATYAIYKWPKAVD